MFRWSSPLVKRLKPLYFCSLLDILSSKFISDFLADALARSEAEFEHLLTFPYAHVYLQLLRWCFCPKIHLQVAQVILRNIEES